MAVFDRFPIPDQQNKFYDAEMIYRETDDKWFIEYGTSDPYYQYLGYAPKPRSVWRGLIHDICHGLMMEYSVWSVIVWSVKQAWEERRRDRSIPFF